MIYREPLHVMVSFRSDELILVEKQTADWNASVQSIFCLGSAHLSGLFQMRDPYYVKVSFTYIKL